MNNSPLVISNIPVRQDSEGRYCLNDLHKASGSNQKNQPYNFSRLSSTKDLQTEIENSSDVRSLNKVQGAKGGTYVCKELVYAYAMWISASFSLKVIRAYDSIITPQPELPTPETTLDSLIPKTETAQTLEGLIYRSIKEPFPIRTFISIENGKASYIKQLSPGEIIFNVDKLENLFSSVEALKKDERILLARIASKQARDSK